MQRAIYMESSEWFPLPEVRLNEEKPWWRDTSHKTTYQAANTSHLSGSNPDVTGKNLTRTHQTHLTPQSTVSVREEPSVADLTITSLMTISPPRCSPSKQPGLVLSNDEHAYTSSHSVNSQLTSFPHTQSNPNAPNAPKKHTHAIPLKNKSSPSLESQLSKQPSNHSTSFSTESSPFTDHYQSTPTSQAHASFSTPPYYATPSSITTNNETAAGTDVPPIQQASLLELDKLWRKFLASSLLNNNKENHPNLQGRCTCGALRKVPQTTSVIAMPTITEDVARSFKTGKGLSKSKKKKRSPTTPHSRFSDTSTARSTSSYSHTLKLIDRSVQTSHITQDTPVIKPPVSFTIPVTQTTPFETKPSKPSTIKPPTAFTIPFIHSSRQQDIQTKTGSTSVTTLVTTPQCAPLQLQQSSHVPPKVLSLSEVFALNCPEFIVHSQRREKRVRQMSEIRREREKTRPAILGCEGTGRAYPLYNPNMKHVPSRYPLVGSGARPKMSHRKMYLSTKKAWERLPEVKKKVEEERKQSQAATNRLRVKLYQKEVLTRLRERAKQH